MKKSLHARTIITCAIAISLFALLVSCGGGGDDGSGPLQTASITLVANPTSLPADGNGSSTITATIRDSSGNPVHTGTDVTFYTTLGRFPNGSTSYKDQTPPPLVDGKPDIMADPTGIVTVALIAGTTPGSAKVTVTSNGVSQTIYITFTGNTFAIGLAAVPTSIPANGTSSSTVTATLTDSSGTAVTPGTAINFTTTLGTFSNGSTSYKTTTPDDKGIVNVSLIADSTPGTAKITATSDSVSQTIYISFTGDTFAIGLAANPASIKADGKSSAIITATLTDSTGAAVTPGTPVSFMTGLGYFQNGEKTYSLTTPDSTGVVQVSLHAGTVPGTTNVVAMSNNISQALSFIMTNAYYSLLSITATPKYIAANGISTSLVQATVTDVSGVPQKDAAISFYDATVDTESTPLPDDNLWKGTGSNLHVTPDFYSYGGSTTFIMTYSGSSISNFAVRLWNRDTGKVTDVLINTTGPVTGQNITKNLVAGNYYFQVDAAGEWEIQIDGSITTAQKGDPIVLAVTRTDANGQADYTYTSTLVPGTVKIKAETGEPTIAETNKEALKATVEIVQTDGPPAPVNVTAEDSEINANGQSETTIEAFILDGQGNIVPDGTAVTFSATAGTLSYTSTTVGTRNTVTVGTVNGVASVKLTSVASATTVQSVVTATAGATASVTVTFRGVSLTNMQATPAAIFANGTDTSTITVRLVDSTGVSIAGETIVFSTTGGTITTAAAKTDTGGVATTELTAPTVTGTATITATYGTHYNNDHHFVRDQRGRFHNPYSGTHQHSG